MSHQQERRKSYIKKYPDNKCIILKNQKAQQEKEQPSNASSSDPRSWLTQKVRIKMVETLEFDQCIDQLILKDDDHLKKIKSDSEYK